ncbi:conserved hypothetical protein [Sporisorium reilianum SRZ2]|uniref:Uncharacterized protein n=1 Tax=Sporisorium reilianum (strain SRZ2) TaxID=999809 RepID=E6ZUT6_SPORE|nr:conserved hypothetical protein [Sporisorium reilianum SRZ2]
MSRPTSGAAASASASTSTSKPTSPSQSRSASTVRSSSTPTTVVAGFAAPAVPASRARPPSSQPPKKASLPPSGAGTAAAQQRSAHTTSPTTTPTSSRRSSVVDPAAYRFSLHVGGIARFPPPSGSAGAQMLRQAAAEAGQSIDPARASVSSAGSSRLSSRYTAEEVAPQRRPVYLALPSDPGAVGPWSSSSSTAVAAKDAQSGKRRNSKIMTSFPFPHPVTPRRRAGDGARAGDADRTRAGLGAAWQRLLTAIFAGPHERRLNREELQDDRITQNIINDIARRNADPAAQKRTTYGTLPLPADPVDPYGYRQLAGPHLLPTYTTDLVARRRERRRARSRARFQCMALWTIWTVSVVLLLIVGVLVFSFVFPDKLDIPNHSDEGEDGVVVHVVGKVVGTVGAAGWSKAVSMAWAGREVAG